jgi:hypothetical protein
MKKRGKVLRDPTTGPGLLMIEGCQYWFSPGEVWQSEVPPRPGLDVEVKFDRAGKILSITTPCESEFSPNPEIRSGGTARAAGAKILRKIAAKCGMPNLLGR